MYIYIYIADRRTARVHFTLFPAAQRPSQIGLNRPNETPPVRGFRSHLGFPRRAAERDGWQENIPPDVVTC